MYNICDMQICMHTCMHPCVRTCVHAYIHSYNQIYIYNHTMFFFNICIHIHLYLYIHTYLHIGTYIYMCIYIYMYMHVWYIYIWYVCIQTNHIFCRRVSKMWKTKLDKPCLINPILIWGIRFEYQKRIKRVGDCIYMLSRVQTKRFRKSLPSLMRSG